MAGVLCSLRGKCGMGVKDYEGKMVLTMVMVMDEVIRRQISWGVRPDLYSHAAPTG